MLIININSVYKLSIFKEHICIINIYDIIWM